MSPAKQKKHDKPLIEHLLELRQRLIYSVVAFAIAFAFAYAYSQEIFEFLLRPLANVFEGEGGRRLIYTGLTEAFVTNIKVALFSATFISFPIVAGQIWMFVAPGLYKHEKRSFLPFLMATPILFIIGAAFAYYAIIPSAWQFFVSFETPGGPGSLPIQLEARVQEYLSLIMQLILAFGISFQLPIVLVILAKIKLITAHMLAARRKYAFLLIMIASAFLTPPDVLSMLGLALPLYILYEISVLLVRIVEKRSLTTGEASV